MRDLIHRARTLFRQNPLLAGLGALVLLVMVAPVLIQLVFLLALLALPVMAGILIGWHLRADPGRLEPFFQWCNRALDVLVQALKALLQWVERQRTGRRAVDPYHDEARRSH